MVKKYLILGTEDHNNLPLFWSQSKCQWVERDEATLYGEKDIFNFPPSELPTGARGVIDIETQEIYTPIPGREGIK
jgi:hypothetical protein